ncbi:MAG: filamentous hemagglutinin N-terminal domain-containing protein [Merismopedia sp. SIO2A8]|nr:filamentous hemagglutinin N-terminal domain-containing protein [Merismopedia sp. SIO2A8]
MAFRPPRTPTLSLPNWIWAIAPLSSVCLSQGLVWGWVTEEGLLRGIEWEMPWRMPEAIAQPIAANDGTHTQVQQTGHHFTISGGTRSGDQSNLFHSFDQFNLESHQIADFRSSSEIHNILGRVINGDASIIDGLIRVSGGESNLFLMNPAGMVFGPNARLDVPRDFTVTTADGIGLNDTWFNAVGDNDYVSLLGSPDGYRFTAPAPGSLVNAGNLTVSNGSALTLLGGTVANTGHLTARGGRITVAAVSGEHYIRLQQDGMLLALEVEPIPNAELRANGLPFTPLDLPVLLTGNSPADPNGTLFPATDLQVNDDGSIRLVGAEQSILTHPGTTLISGALTTTSRVLDLIPEINILGTHIALLDAELSASGVPGGIMRLGGDYQGQGNIPNAALTYVDAHTTLVANGLQTRDQGRLATSAETSDGGRIFIWADDTTQFYGNITAQGHPSGGDGGFVEVSGHQNLVFSGTVDLTAPNGHTGSLLLDPRNITIVNGSGNGNSPFSSDRPDDVPVEVM